MQRLIFFAKIGFLCNLIMAWSIVGAFDTIASNYVIIGAFASQQNAVSFTTQARTAKLDARFEINPNRNLYYVYVLTTSSRRDAIREALRLRKETRYADAWVYNGALGVAENTGTEQLQNVVKQDTSTDINPVTAEPIIEVGVKNDSVASQANVTVPGSDPASSTKTMALTAGEVAGKNFVFQLYRAIDNRPVPGEVVSVDVAKARKMATYKANAPVKVTAPSGNSGVVSFVCEVFGYRKVQREFNFNAPPPEGVEVDEAGNIVISFDLIRLQRGDIAVMYNVFFYKDAAIMRPESRYEVNNLLEMLKETPSCKIRIHGHTNGNAAGKIISMGEGNDFFSLTGKTTEGFGSAKKLSEERAKAIKQYLTSNGIDDTRTEVKAWGGKRAIHDKTSARAHENVRVEVEILEH